MFGRDTQREHAPYHERQVEQQQLDALLRIEELLAQMVEDRTPYTGPPLEDVMTNIEPAGTPFMKKLGKRK
jgi:hypothetical protein